MRRYIELTLSEGLEVPVDISAMLHVSPTKAGGCIIYLINGGIIRVQEPFAEVRKKVLVALRR